MNWLERFYSWFWFHTEFWWTPLDRRPYTFVMRDWIYRHAIATFALILGFYTGMIVLSLFGHGTISTLTASLCSLLLAHLVWGTKWIEGEQELPTYLGEI